MTETAVEPLQFTETTPSGIEVFYEAKPRRHYQVRQNEHLEGVRRVDGTEWVEVPSVTTVLDILSKGGGLINWGQSTGIEGVLELVRRGKLAPLLSGSQVVLGLPVGMLWQEASAYDVLDLLKVEQLTIDDQKESASDRGNSVHRALETWCDNATLPVPDAFPETERGYVEGLLAFLEAIDGVTTDVVSERMVGSIEHGYAGRYDLELVLDEDVEVVSRVYPKKAPKIGVMRAGRWRLDLKTSKHIYESHFLQLAGYEGAAVECGYEPADYHGVIHVTDDGRYELVESPAEVEDFLAVREAFSALERLKGWKKR